MSSLVIRGDLLERPTEALLGMRRKWEDHQEFSRAEWEVLARYAEKGCEQHGFSSDESPSRETPVNKHTSHITNDNDRRDLLGVGCPAHYVYYGIDGDEERDGAGCE